MTTNESTKRERTPKSKKITVVVADDHPAFRMGIVSLVNRQIDMSVVGEAASAKEAMELSESLQPDIVLIDLRMPGGSGFEAIPRLVAPPSETRVIVLTTYDLDEDIYRAVRAGAMGYLLKDSTMAEIADGIRRVMRGEKIFQPQLEPRLDHRLKRKELTERELEILQLIVKGQANKEISATLFISEDTVKAHLKSLFVKMEVNGRTEAAIEAVRSGLVYL